MDEQAFRPQWQFKFQAHFDKWFGLPQCLKTYHLSLYNIKKDMLKTGPFAVLSMPSFDFHLPPCTEGFLIHLSPLWQLSLWRVAIATVSLGGKISLYTISIINDKIFCNLEFRNQQNHIKPSSFPCCFFFFFFNFLFFNKIFVYTESWFMEWMDMMDVWTFLKLELKKTISMVPPSNIIK